MGAATIRAIQTKNDTTNCVLFFEKKKKAKPAMP
jgi:hypothetical protein